MPANSQLRLAFLQWVTGKAVAGNLDSSETDIDIEAQAGDPGCGFGTSTQCPRVSLEAQLSVAEILANVEGKQHEASRADAASVRSRRSRRSIQSTRSFASFKSHFSRLSQSSQCHMKTRSLRRSKQYWTWWPRSRRLTPSLRYVYLGAGRVPATNRTLDTLES